MSLSDTQIDTTAQDSTCNTGACCDEDMVTPQQVVNVGKYIGQCKWFNDVLGYGFVTQQSGDDKGKDIFVHHSGIHPLNSHYKTLRKGEYVNFNIVCGDNGDQAVDVTGINGGTLMCDVSPIVRASGPRDAKGGSPTYQGSGGRGGGGRGRAPGGSGARGGGRGGGRGYTSESV